MEKLASIDVRSWVRQRPERFFNVTQPHRVHLLSYVMADILELGQGDCLIRSIGAWSVVGSNVAWLEQDAIPLRELFERVVAAPEHGEHSMRAEVLMGAFAADVTVKSRDAELLVVKGERPAMDALDAAEGMRQAIIFRMP